jgi:hypothetical protein
VRTALQPPASIGFLIDIPPYFAFKFSGIYKFRHDDEKFGKFEIAVSQSSPTATLFES